jgi:hypothetical protein
VKIVPDDWKDREHHEWHIVCADCGAVGFHPASKPEDGDDLRALREAVERFDHEVTEYPGADGFVKGYSIPVGPLHRLLAEARR